MTYLFTCPEPKGIRVRMVSEIEKIPANIAPLYRQLSEWNKHLGPETIGEFYNDAKRFWLVDDVGVIWTTQHSKEDLEGHFVFWDGRLRGREGLIRGMATVVMDLAGVNRLWCFVPQEKRMILNFLWRVGFSMEFATRGLCKVFIVHP